MKTVNATVGRNVSNGPLRSGSLARAAIGVGAAVLVAVLALNEVRYNTPSFDGAMNLQAAQSLARSGRYATTYDRVVEFDHRVQSGAPLVVPIALGFALWGESNWTAQLPNVVYLAGACSLLALFACRLAGAWAGILSLLLILSTRSLLDLGLRVYGEIPALFFCAVALLAFAAWEVRGRSAPGLASLVGAAVGMAVLTKAVMLLVAAVFVVATVAAWASGLRRFSRREGLAFGAGAVAVVGSFELFRLFRLGREGFLSWWKIQLGGIGQQSGLNDAGSQATELLASVSQRFSKLSLELGVDPSWLALFLVGPYVLLAALGASGSLRVVPRRASLLLLATMSASYLSWWLLMTPLNRMWLRRVVDGVLLHCVLAAIVLVAAARAMSSLRPNGGKRARTGALLLNGIPALALVLGAGAFARFEGVRLRSEPTPERLGVEAIAKRIRSLPPDAVIYGRGWWQAPVVSFFSRRSFADLDRFPRTRMEQELDDHYLVADAAYTRLAPSDLGETLKRLDSRVIGSAHDHSLHGIRKVYPYEPFSDEERGSELEKLVDVVDGDYELLRGFHEPAADARWARMTAGILLARDADDCLKVSLWFPDMARYPAGHVRLVVEVDDRLVREETIDSGGAWEAVLQLPKSVPPSAAGEVEVGIDKWWLDQGSFAFAQLGFLVSEVGFVDCQNGEQRWVVTQESSDAIVIRDYGPREAIVGRGFHVQPDGSSAMWFRVEASTAPAWVLFGSDRLRGWWNPERGELTVALDSAALAAPGAREVRLCDRAGVCSAPVRFLVRPGRADS